MRLHAFLSSRPARAGLAAAGLALLLASGARALPMTGSWGVDFRAGSQSIWGPGGSSADFGASGSVGGSVFAASYDTGASTGTVAGNVRGTVHGSWNDQLAAPGIATVGLRYAGGSSRLDTALGANLDVTADINVSVPLVGSVSESFCLYCKDYDLDTAITFTSNLGTQRSATGSFTGVGVGPNLIVAGGSVNIDVAQDVKFTPTGVTGLLRATNQDTGSVRSVGFDLADAVGTSFLDLDLSLDEAGIWDVSLLDLDLANRFLTTFGLDLNIELWWDLLVAGDSTTIPVSGVDLFDSPTFGLDFGSLSPIAAFSIEVVPEPGVSLLLAAGLAGLVRFGRRRGA
jgi:hypothetical protein